MLGNVIMKLMDKEEIFKYWLDSSERDFELCQSLFESKRYSYSLFFLHLSLEKLLKAMITKRTDIQAPHEHNLVRLAEITSLEFSKEYLDFLSDATTFNIRGRYDDYKNQFYKLATKEYAEEYINKSKEIILWLKEHSQTK